MEEGLACPRAVSMLASPAPSEGLVHTRPCTRACAQRPGTHAPSQPGSSVEPTSDQLTPPQGQGGSGPSARRPRLCRAHALHGRGACPHEVTRCTQRGSLAHGDARGRVCREGDPLPSPCPTVSVSVEREKQFKRVSLKRPPEKPLGNGNHARPSRATALGFTSLSLSLRRGPPPR